MTLLIKEKYQTERIQYLTKACELLNFDDWSNELLEKISQECGFDRHYHYVLFPSGINEVVELFSHWQDEQMLEKLNNTPINSVSLKIRDKISAALKLRIKMFGKFVQIKNNAYLIKPDNLILAAKIAWNSCNIIWYYAGDKSTDYNHYTKRALLVSVYLSAILFYITDESEDTVKTDRFIDSSLEKIVNFAKIYKLPKFPEIYDIPILRLFCKKL